MADIDKLVEQTKQEAATKKERFHKNLQITFTALGILTFVMSGLVNYYTLQKLRK